MDMDHNLIEHMMHLGGKNVMLHYWDIVFWWNECDEGKPEQGSIDHWIRADDEVMGKADLRSDEITLQAIDLGK